MPQNIKRCLGSGMNVGNNHLNGTSSKHRGSSFFTQATVLFVMLSRSVSVSALKQSAVMSHSKELQTAAFAHSCHIN